MSFYYRLPVVEKCLDKCLLVENKIFLQTIIYRLVFSFPGMINWLLQKHKIYILCSSLCSWFRHEQLGTHEKRTQIQLILQRILEFCAKIRIISKKFGLMERLVIFWKSFFKFCSLYSLFLGRVKSYFMPELVHYSWIKSCYELLSSTLSNSGQLLKTNGKYP